MPLSAQDTRIALLGATTVTGDQVTLPRRRAARIQATLDTSPLTVGSWQVAIRLTEVDDDETTASDGDRRPPSSRATRSRSR